jgi:hypothetical protein
MVPRASDPPRPAFSVRDTDGGPSRPRRQGGELSDGTGGALCGYWRCAVSANWDMPVLDVSRAATEARFVVQQAAGVYLRHTQPRFVGLLIHGLIHGSALKGGFTSILLTRFLDQCLALSGKVHVRFLVARHVHQSSV